MSARARVPVTFLVTAIILFGEFSFLTTLFHLDDHVEDQRWAQARVSGTIQAWEPGSPTAPVRRAVRALTAVDAAGAAPLQRATDRWADQPDAAGLARVRAQDDAVAEGIVRDLRASSVRVDVILATLLLVVSVGWFVWFRRLVLRHRRLQQAVTEKQTLDAGERRLMALVRNSVDLVVVLEPDSTASFVSPSSTSVLGLGPEELTGRRFVDLLAPADVPLFVGLIAGDREGEQSVLLQVPHRDGRELVLEGTLNNLLAEPALHGWVLTVRDVTEREVLHRQLDYLGFHDALTGLPNRQLFADRLAHALRSRDRAVEPLVVLVIALDDFQQVNDTRGHASGDHLLAAVADRIGSVVRQGDTAARLGGDQFAILMEGADTAEAREVADRLLEVLAAPGQDQPTVQASVGIAEAKPGESDPEETLRHADVAMHWAKDRGRGRVAVYEAGLHAEALDRLTLRGELHRAVAGGELVLHFQPTVDLVTHRVTGFEALVRWDHPERGLLPPAQFLPFAQHSAIAVPLGSWVLREACRAGASLQTPGQSPSMAINVVAAQLGRPDFADEVAEVLAATGMPADRLVLEITESMLLDQIEITVLSLTRLRSLGVRIAIDDFGTGYSSLSYLSQLPVDILKIDKSFVDHVHEGGHDTSVVETIISLSRSLRLVTVGEGVEEPEQAEWLRLAGCSVGQGFLWSRPVELDSARAILTSGVAHDVRPLARPAGQATT